MQIVSNGKGLSYVKYVKARGLDETRALVGRLRASAPYVQ